METIKRLLAAIDAVFIRRVLRFGVTGVWNTGFSYAVYALAIYFGVWHYIAVLFAYLAGAINNYLTFRFFVFGDRRSAPVSRYLVGFVMRLYFSRRRHRFVYRCFGNQQIPRISFRPAANSRLFVFRK